MQEVLLKRAKTDPNDLSETEIAAIAEYEQAKKKGKLISHEQLKKELGARCT